MEKTTKLWYTIDLAAKMNADEIRELELKLPDLMESLGISEYNGPSFSEQTTHNENEV